MATEVKWRGGSTLEHSTFTGAAKEITVDTDKKTLVVHDGSTVGGFPLAREDDVSNRFDGVISDFYGNTDPSLDPTNGVIPGAVWADTLNNAVKRRNDTNDGWVIESRLFKQSLPIFELIDVPTSDIGPIYIVGSGVAEWDSGTSQYQTFALADGSVTLSKVSTEVLEGLNHTYDNTNSKLVSTNVQDAVDEVVGILNGHKNKIINGMFFFNQRSYVSGAATSVGQYTFDRWKVTATSGLTFSFINNKMTITIPSGQTIQQIIEAINLESGDYVLSWEGTAQGRVNGGAYGNSGEVVATIVGGTNTTIELTNGTVSYVQFEKGVTPTSFEHRPYSLELFYCRRYFNRTPQAIRGSFADVGTSGYATWWFPSSMRVAPNIALGSGSSGSFSEVNSEFATLTIVSSYPLFGAGSSANAEL